MEIRKLRSEDVWDHENAFYWFSPQNRLKKILAQYEIYKRITTIPGHIAEFGVYKGASLIRLATFRASLENDDSRKIIGFDAFGSFPKQENASKEDLDFIDRFETAGADGLEVSELEAIIDMKGFRNVELVKGDVMKTLPTYLDQHPESRFALLHIDLTVREPSELVLDLLFERVVPGGIIVFDDYNAVAGETDAADRFIRDKNLKIEKLPFYNVPSFVVMK